MDSTEQIKALEERIVALESVINGMKTTPDIDPESARALGFAIIKTSSDVVTDYDRAVNESGSSNYTVPAIYNGLFYINGKIVGYYDPV